jgi:bifunctional non-homologous end joining protein LigD
LLYRRGRAVLYAFDLLWVDGKDLRQMPLIVRKRKLEQLIKTDRVQGNHYAQHVEGSGKLLLEEVCERNLIPVVPETKLIAYS